MVSEGLVKLDALVSHTYPLAETAQAIRKLRDRVDEPLKVQIKI